MPGHLLGVKSFRDSPPRPPVTASLSPASPGDIAAAPPLPRPQSSGEKRGDGKGKRRKNSVCCYSSGGGGKNRFWGPGHPAGSGGGGGGWPGPARAEGAAPPGRDLLLPAEIDKLLLAFKRRGEKGRCGERGEKLLRQLGSRGRAGAWSAAEPPHPPPAPWLYKGLLPGGGCRGGLRACSALLHTAWNFQFIF